MKEIKMSENDKLGNLAQTVIVIPTLDPDDRLPEYVCALLEIGFGQVIIVDDGSKSDRQKVFGKLKILPRTAVLHHDKNHGKGVALRTAFRFIMNGLHGYKGVLTADSDGQHTVGDCVKLAKRMLSCDANALYLGTRDYTKKEIPARSRVGNVFTSIIFKILFGQWLKDTQTGLRAFPVSMLPMMLKVEGERYEYEMSMLIACRQQKIPILTMDIDTIYENNNEASHYNPLKDSVRIAKVMAWNFIKFMGASLAATLLEWGIFGFLRYGVMPNNIVGTIGSDDIFGMDMISTVAARIVSATVNYILNRKIVFRDRGNIGNSLWRYALLCVCVAAVSGGCVYLLELIHVPAILAKIIVDTILYFVNYRIQKSWVFKDNEMTMSN